MATIINVQGLRKNYGDVQAVQGMDLEVQSGEIFAMLGPNGAGESTTVEILEGLRHRDSGDVSVLGIDPEAEPHRLKSRIGVVLEAEQLADRVAIVGPGRLN